MDKTNFIGYMNAIKRYNTESDELNKHIKAIAQGAFCEVGYNLLDVFTNLLSEAIGDEDEMVSWYVFDNDFGARGFKAGREGKLKRIKTLDELWTLIQDNKGE